MPSHAIDPAVRALLPHICESAATREDWREDRRTVERFHTRKEAWDRMNEHADAGRRACSFTETATLRASAVEALEQVADVARTLVHAQAIAGDALSRL